ELLLVSGDRGRLRPGAGLAGPQLAHAGALADLLAQVVELGAVDVADLRDLDLVDLRRVQRERALHPHTERLVAHGEGLVHPGALLLEHDPLEDLDALPLALDHLEVDPHRVAGLEPRHLAQLPALELIDEVAHRKEGPRGPTRNGSGNGAEGYA